MTNKPNFSFMTLAVKSIIMNNGKLLILQRNPKLKIENNWDLPGGLINENESKEDALIREVKEEIGTIIEIVEKDGVWSFIRTYDGKRVYAQNYICKLIDNKTKIKLSEEHLAYKWINPYDITKYNVKDKSLQTLILKLKFEKFE